MAMLVTQVVEVSHALRRYPEKSFFILQRDPKGIAKKNVLQLEHGNDIFSQLAPILRSDW